MSVFEVLKILVNNCHINMLLLSEEELCPTKSSIVLYAWIIAVATFLILIIILINYKYRYEILPSFGVVIVDILDLVE
jgi:preprotein translocase subunit SecF